MPKDLSYANIDTAMTANSDLKVPSEKAAKSYIDTTVSALKSYVDTSVSAKQATLTKAAIVGAANQITCSVNTQSVIGANVTISLVDSPIVNNITISNSLVIATLSTVSAQTSSGTTGTIKWDNENLYICVATNTWTKVATTTSW